MQDACDKGLDPDEFVEDMKKKGIRVAGIGHRIKSKVGSTSVKQLLTLLSSLTGLIAHTVLHCPAEGFIRQLAKIPAWTAGSTGTLRCACRHV